MKKFSERLKELRGDVSQAKAAELMGWPQQTWGKYESDVIEPKISTAAKLCVTFNTSADWLLGLTDRHRQLSGGDMSDPRVAALEAENAALRGEVRGLRYALEAAFKGAQAVPATVSHGRPAPSVA